MSRISHFLASLLAAVVSGGTAALAADEPSAGWKFNMTRLTAAEARKAADAKAINEKIDLSAYESPSVSADTSDTTWRWKITYIKKSHSRDECFSVVIDDASSKAVLTWCKQVASGLTTRSSGPWTP